MRRRERQVIRRVRQWRQLGGSGTRTDDEYAEIPEALG